MAAEKKSPILCSGESNKVNSTETLFDSIRDGKKTATIKVLILEGADVNARDTKGYTPLLLASQEGRKAVVDLLIDSGAKVDGSECLVVKRTLLHNASKHGWTDIVQSLVKRVPISPSMEHSDCSDSCAESIYSTIHARDINGDTALHIASGKGHLDIVKCLIKKGANLDVRNKIGATALYRAAEENRLQVVKFLVEEGAAIDTKDNYGHKALHIAARIGNLNVTKFLVYEGINYGVNVNCHSGDGLTVLHYASKFGWLEMVQFLVKRAPLLLSMEDRESVISCAETTCLTIHTRDMDGRTALSVASRYGYREVVKYLIKEGADVNIRNKNGQTALYEASIFGYGAIVRCLVEAGADMNLKSYCGVSPLLAAARASRDHIVHQLMNSGANFDGCDENKCTVLHYASQKGWMHIVQSLVKRGPDLDAKESNGNTALLLACGNRRMPIVECLLQAGASWDIADTYGNLPLNILSRQMSASAKITKLFIEAGAYLMPVDYYLILQYSCLKRPLLQDVNFCCQAIINKFNAHDLPALYKLPVSVRLPRIEKMVVSGSQVAQAIEQTVKLEIKTNGYCDVLEVRPMMLSLLSVRSVLEYYNKKKSESQKKLKRLAESDSKNEYQRLSKSMRLI